MANRSKPTSQTKTKKASTKQSVVRNTRVPKILYKVAALSVWKQSLLFATIIALVAGSGYFVYRSMAAGPTVTWDIPFCQSQRIVLSQSRNRTHPCVKAVQVVLVTQFKYCPGAQNIVIDSVYGPVTESYVRCYQRDQRITADGIVGPVTYQHMNSTCRGVINWISLNYNYTRLSLASIKAYCGR